MKISLIVAMSQNQVIGTENRLPWHLPADLAWFKKNTLGKTILMGRKTWESLPIKPLPQRHHIILTQQTDYRLSYPKTGKTTTNTDTDAPGNNPKIRLAHSIDQALAQAKQLCTRADDELMIIGGASIYAKFLPYCERLYITMVERDFTGDATFPPIQQAQWQTCYREDGKADAKNSFDYHFLILEKKPT